jgi:hypothetical protein
MRFEVPQFIEIEDKIIGPLSWRQFLYVGGGVGMAVVLFLTTPFLVFVIIGVPLALIALALAFYPVNNRPFSYFLEAMFHYFSRHRLYVWRRHEGMVYEKKPAETAPVARLLRADRPLHNAPSITSLARKLEMQALQKKDF